MRFDKAASPRQFYNIADSDSLTLPASDWAVGVWARVGDNAGSSFAYILSNNNFHALNSFNLHIIEDGQSPAGVYNFSVRDDLNRALNLQTARYGGDGSWRLFVMQRRSDRLELWSSTVGGRAVLEASASMVGYGSINGGFWRLGGRTDAESTRFFRGDAHDWWVLTDGALTPTEIAGLSAGRTIVELGKTPALWHPLMSADATLRDRSTNAHDAIRNGGPVTVDGPGLGMALPPPPPSEVTIAPDDAALFYSSHATRVTPTTAFFVLPGSYVKFKFTGSSIKASFDTSGLEALNVAASQYPVYRVVIDGVVQERRQLTSGSPTVTLASGLADTEHTFELQLMSSSNAHNAWNSAQNTLRVTGYHLEPGKRIRPADLRPKRMLAYGDSHFEGTRYYENSTSVWAYNAMDQVMHLTAANLGAELDNVAQEGQGLTVTYGGRGFPRGADSYNFFYRDQSRLPGGRYGRELDYVLIEWGANDHNLNADRPGFIAAYEALIGNVRAAAPNAVIFCLVPFRQVFVTEVTQGYNNYMAKNPGDTTVHLLNLGPTGASIVRNNNFDGTHMNARGHELMSRELTAAIHRALNRPPTAAFSHSCTDLGCHFTDASADGDGTVIAWSWDFGDGNGSSTRSPSHSYAIGGTYTVSLTVTDDQEAIHRTSQTITVTAPNSPPSAAFSHGCTDLGCHFTDASTDSDGTVVAWSWIFGDGNGSSSQNPSHRYATAGSYTLSLTVTDDRGATHQTSRSVTVTAPQTVTLSATGSRTKNRWDVRLTWSGATSTHVDIYRNGTRITTARNSGSHTDSVNGGSSHTYRICQAGTNICSNEATVP